MNNNKDIPKIIHQIWLQGEENILESNNNKINNIKKLHPDWKYILWDEPMIINLIKNNKEYLDKYYKFIYLHQKVDFSKFVILEKYGGIYIDIDCDVIKNLDNIFILIKDYDLIISELNNNLDTVSSLLTCHKTCNCYNNGIIIGKPQTRVLNFLINGFKYDCRFYENKILCIQNTTGPPIFNKLIEYYKKNISNKDILVLPYDYFEPCINKKCNITNNTHIIHKHELSWLDTDQKKIFNTLTEINLTHLIFYLVIIVILVLYFKNKR